MSMTVDKPIILQAFEGTNKRVPVWFMRQAGRYLPEYRAIKKTMSFWEMVEDPDTAAEVTCLPVHILGVDAAIFFSDIFTLPKSMGFDIEFKNGHGPVINNTYRSIDDLKSIHAMGDQNFTAEAIKRTKANLPDEVPLIGFAGGPFTVATYLIEGGSSKDFSGCLRMMYSAPEVFHALMDVLTENTITYLKLQQDAGADIIQVMDTWAGMLRPFDFERFVRPYLNRIFAAMEGPTSYYAKNASHLLPCTVKLDCDFIGVCEKVTIGQHPTLNDTDKGIQGNLFNGVLYADENTIGEEVDKVLNAAKAQHKRFIFNLSHGMMPDMDPEKTKFAVKRAQAFTWSD